MDYFSMRTGDKSSPYVDELIVNTLADIDKIPVDNYNPGTICIVISTVSAYMLDLNKKWQPV